MACRFPAASLVLSLALAATGCAGSAKGRPCARPGLSFGGERGPDEPPRPIDRAEPPGPEALQGQVHTNMACEVDPCVDFYEYACGGFTGAVELGELWRTSGAGLAEASLRNIVQREALLTAAAKQSGNLLGDFYRTCVDRTAHQADALAPLLPYAQAINAISAPSDVVEVAAGMAKVGVRGPLSLDVHPVVGDDLDLVVGLGAFGLVETVGRPLTRSEEAEYVEHVSSVLRVWGQPEQNATALANAIVELERALRDLREAAPQRGLAARAHIQRESPTFARYLDAALGSTWGEAVVPEVEASRGLDQLLADPRFGVSTWQAYLLWRLSDDLGRFVFPLDIAHFAFHWRKRSGEGDPTIESVCLVSASALLPDAMDEAFVARWYSPTVEQETRSLLAEIRRAFRERIAELPWVDTAAAQALLAREEAIHYEVGRGEGASFVPTGVRIDPAHHGANAVALRAADIEHLWSLVGKPKTERRRPVPSHELNAYYAYDTHSVHFTPAYLQAPLFHPDYPAPVNFAIAGATIGHEILHAFNPRAPQGLPRGVELDAARASAFGEAAQCLVEQYDAYRLADEVAVDGSRTFDENAADLGGARLAYRSFLRWRAEQGDAGGRETLRGLTPEQTFFVAFAQSHCGYTGPLSAKHYASSGDPHAPNAFRVNGVVANMPEFGEAFGCEPGTPMRRDPVCEPW